MTIDAVIFDCDGTLVDSEVLSNEVLVEYVAELGLVLSLEEAVGRFPGRGLAVCMAEIERRLGRALPADFEVVLRRRTADVFRERLRPIDGAEALVRGLRLPYCVASGGPREKTELTLSLTGLRPYFEGRIFSSYDVGAWKPDPTLFLHCADHLGVAPRRCAVVEDTDAGIEAGIAAGMIVFAFDPRHPDRDVPAGVELLGDLRDLTGYLGR